MVASSVRRTRSGNSGGGGGPWRRKLSAAARARAPQGGWEAAARGAAKAGCIAGSTFGLCSVVAQSVTREPVSAERAVRAAAFGLCVKGPLYYCFQLAVEGAAPGRGPAAVAFKLCTDVLLWSMFINTTFLFSMPLLEGKAPRECWERVRRQIVGVQLDALRLWPAAHVVNYGLVPLAMRVPFVSGVNLLWTTILSIRAAAA